VERTSDVANKLPPRFENGRRTISDTRLFFAVPDIIVMECDFTQCKFHRRTDTGESRIVGESFIGCNFERCVFGGTAYKHVRFERCNFRRCDFGMAQFLDCQFQSCIFKECTSEHVSLSATELNPREFLAGAVAPHYNYGSSYEGELSPEALDSQWMEIRRALAAQLLKSNTEIHHTDNSDAALVALKRAELRARVDRLSSRSLRAGVFALLREWARCATTWLILVGTNGGTSVARLVGIAAIAILFYAFLLSVSSVQFQDKPCRVLHVTAPAVVEQVARAASLFLAMGYTAFSGGDVTEVVLLTAGAAIGLIWYALLAAVVIRRVYR
jgi:uncharacterized protein YjbI with pentapeptide repeats